MISSTGVLPEEPIEKPAFKGERSFRYRVPRFGVERKSGAVNVYRYQGDKQRLALAQLGETGGEMMTTAVGARGPRRRPEGLQRKQALLEAQVAIQAAEKALNP